MGPAVLQASGAAAATWSRCRLPMLLQSHRPPFPWRSPGCECWRMALGAALVAWQRGGGAGQGETPPHRCHRRATGQHCSQRPPSRRSLPQLLLCAGPQMGRRRDRSWGESEDAAAHLGLLLLVLLPVRVQDGHGQQDAGACSASESRKRMSGRRVSSSSSGDACQPLP